MATKYLRGGDHGTTRVETARLMSTTFIQALRDRFENGWDKIPEGMWAAGLDDVVSDCVSTDRLPETRERTTTKGMRAIFAWARLVAARGAEDAPGWMVADELQRVEKETFEDTKSGCYCSFDIHVVCGQKPRDHLHLGRNEV